MDFEYQIFGEIRCYLFGVSNIYCAVMFVLTYRMNRIYLHDVYVLNKDMYGVCTFNTVLNNEEKYFHPTDQCKIPLSYFEGII